jgi:hypothetical protein
VNTDACILHILHAPGHADLGLPTDAPREHLLAQLADAGVDKTADILRLRLLQQAGDTPPLGSMLSTWFENATQPVDSIHLMLISTPHVIDIARVIERALRAKPALYGNPI